MKKVIFIIGFFVLIVSNMFWNYNLSYWLEDILRDSNRVCYSHEYIMKEEYKIQEAKQEKPKEFSFDDLIS